MHPTLAPRPATFDDSPPWLLFGIDEVTGDERDVGPCAALSCGEHVGELSLRVKGSLALSLRS